MCEPAPLVSRYESPSRKKVKPLQPPKSPSLTWLCRPLANAISIAPLLPANGLVGVQRAFGFALPAGVALLAKTRCLATAKRRGQRGGATQSIGLGDLITAGAREANPALTLIAPQRNMHGSTGLGSDWQQRVKSEGRSVSGGHQPAFARQV